MVEHETKVVKVNDKVVYCMAKITGNDYFRYFLLDNNNRQKSEFPFASVDKPDDNGNYIVRTSGSTKELGQDFTHEEVIRWAIKQEKERK